MLDPSVKEQFSKGQFSEAIVPQKKSSVKEQFSKG